MLIQDRVKLIIKANQETASSFADKVGVKRSGLSHVLNGRNNPSLDFLAKVLTHYPQVNASWLITGVAREGEFEEKMEASKEGSTKNGSNGKIERIVIFYNNGTMGEYLPNAQ